MNVINPVSEAPLDETQQRQRQVEREFTVVHFVLQNLPLVPPRTHSAHSALTAAGR